MPALRSQCARLKAYAANAGRSEQRPYENSGKSAAEVNGASAPRMFAGHGMPCPYETKGNVNIPTLCCTKDGGARLGAASSAPTQTTANRLR